MSPLEVRYLQPGEPAICGRCQKPLDVEGKGSFPVVTGIAVLAETGAPQCFHCITYYIGDSVALHPALGVFLSFRNQEIGRLSAESGQRQKLRDDAQEEARETTLHQEGEEQSFRRSVEEIIRISSPLLPLRRERVLLLRQLSAARIEARRLAGLFFNGGSYVWSPQRDEAEKLFQEENRKAEELEVKIAELEKTLQAKESELRAKLLGELAQEEGDPESTPAATSIVH